MLNCQQAEDLLSDVETDDPGLSAEDRAAFFEHLTSCASCREFWEQSQRVSELLQAYGTYSPDTVALLEAQGETVPQYLRPAPRGPDPEEEPKIDMGVRRPGRGSWPGPRSRRCWVKRTMSSPPTPGGPTAR